ncbi:MAG: magnesium transporter [Ruminococcaceae bacterium]|nr:magnesium transporter [Oscillospiraceae bacterium]
MAEEIKVHGAQERPDYTEELIALLRSRRPIAELRQEMEDYHDGDLADLLEQLSGADRRRMYRILGLERTSDVFAYLEDVGTYIEELDAEMAADVIEGMDADDAVDVLDELDEDKRRELLELMDPDAAEDIQLIDSYEDEQIGSRMTTNYVAVSRECTIREAMKSLVRQAADNDNIATIYTLDEDGIFYGAIDLKDLIIARTDVVLEDLIVTSYPFVYATQSIDSCIEELKDYSEDSIPVLDADNRLLGVITAQDIVEVVDEEMGEDYARLAGLTAEEDLNEPLGQSMRKRIPWLVILLFLGLGVSTVVGMFETVVSSLTLIVCFQSLILSMAGNVGTQSLAVTIRVLMDEELSGKQSFSLVMKELRVGLCNGTVLGAISTGLIGLYIWLLKGNPASAAFATSGCIGLAMVLAMTVSSLTGTLIPMLFKKIKVDPAVASGPLITTFNDLVAVVAYYGLAWVFLISVMN